MRLYADFNAQVDLGGPDRPALVHLNRMGTLRDLCASQTPRRSRADSPHGLRCERGHRSRRRRTLGVRPSVQRGWLLGWRVRSERVPRRSGHTKQVGIGLVSVRHLRNEFGRGDPAERAVLIHTLLPLRSARSCTNCSPRGRRLTWNCSGRPPFLASLARVFAAEFQDVSRLRGDDGRDRDKA
jgi:hypothetical protein